jgi:energy-coupling factor transporter ATP-binding protein EcfA2
MLPASVSLYDRQLLFVTGKGGVGKTTVAAALALAATRAGRRRVIVCEVGGQARVPVLLGAKAGRPGEEVQVDEGLWSLTIDPRQALEEWLAKILGSRQLTHVLARSNFFSAFVGAAPGAAELVAMTKSWELAQSKRWDSKRRGYDLVIVDGPASGHAIGMLRTPGTFADIARVGPIASQSERVREFLGDHRRSAYVAVALPAELPVSETLDLGGRLRRAIGRRLEAIVVNGVLPDRFTAQELERVEASGTDPLLGGALRGAEARTASQAEHLARLGAEADVGEDCLLRLPFVFTPRLARDDVEGLAERLTGA